MFKHFNLCMQFRDLCSMFAIRDVSDVVSIVDKNKHIHNAVVNNIKIIHRHNNYYQLEFLEAYYIKQRNPLINYGI